MAIPPVPTPTADLALTYTPRATPLPNDPTAQILQTVVEVPLQPDGDVATVVGIAKLRQTVLRLLYTPLGADPFNPDWGCQLWAYVGQPVTSTDVYQQALDASLQDFAARQAADAAAGWLALDEQIASWEITTIVLIGPVLTVALTVIAQTGESTNVPPASFAIAR